MRSFLLLYALCLRTSLAAPHPEPAAEIGPGDVKVDVKDENGNVTGQIVLTGFDKCDVEDPCDPSTSKRDDIIDGLDDMIRMIPYKEPNFPLDWKNAPVMEFFGPKWRNEQWRKKIQGMLSAPAPKNLLGITELTFSFVENVYGLTQVSRGWIFGWRLHVRCDDIARAVRRHNHPILFLPLLTTRCSVIVQPTHMYVQKKALQNLLTKV
jgi:hypothetical protein